MLYVSVLFFRTHLPWLYPLSPASAHWACKGKQNSAWPNAQAREHTGDGRPREGDEEAEAKKRGGGNETQTPHNTTHARTTRRAPAPHDARRGHPHTPTRTHPRKAPRTTRATHPAPPAQPTTSTKPIVEKGIGCWRKSLLFQRAGCSTDMSMIKAHAHVHGCRA